MTTWESKALAVFVAFAFYLVGCASIAMHNTFTAWHPWWALFVGSVALSISLVVRIGERVPPVTHVAYLTAEEIEVVTAMRADKR